MTDLISAILPLVGVAVGAGFQFLATRARERERQVDSLRTQAYADYLRAVAAAAHVRSDEEQRDAHRDLADAKARIAVYGTIRVIRALAEFEKLGAVLNNSASYAAFVSLVACMRNGFPAEFSKDIEIVLIGVPREEKVAERALPAATK